jgi:hypothetical protein
MNEPYPPGGGEPYPGGGQPYPGGGQPYPGGGAPGPGGWQPPPQPGDQSPYTAYPGGPAPYGSYGQPPAPQQPPQSIKIAVTLMYVGAGLEILGFVLNLIASGQGSSSAGSSAFGAAIGAGLWLWMAWANKAGKSWARIVSTVFFGIDCLLVLLVLVAVGTIVHVNSGIGAPTSGILVVAVLAALIVWLLGLVTIVLLWRRESSAYYAAMSGRR